MNRRIGGRRFGSSWDLGKQSSRSKSKSSAVTDRRYVGRRYPFYYAQGQA